MHFRLELTAARSATPLARHIGQLLSALRTVVMPRARFPAAARLVGTIAARIALRSAQGRIVTSAHRFRRR